MISKTFTVRNRLGIHARPSAQLVVLTNRFKSDIVLELNDMRVDCKNIMDVMFSSGVLGDQLKVHVNGPDEEEAMKAIQELMDTGFGEDCLF